MSIVTPQAVSSVPLNLSAIKNDAAIVLAKKQLELQNLQILTKYEDAAIRDMSPLNSLGPEREWDRFFERLEERFLIANVPNEYKEPLARRLLRGLALRTWVEISAENSMSYEEIRDRTILTFFPHSAEFQRLIQLMTSRTSEIASNSSNNDEKAEKAMTGEGVESTEPRMGRRWGSSLSSVRSSIAAHRLRLLRVRNRHPHLDMPREEEFVKMAISMLRPSLAEAAATIKETEDVGAFFAALNQLDIARQVEEGPRPRRPRQRRSRRHSGNPSCSRP